MEIGLGKAMEAGTGASVVEGVGSVQLLAGLVETELPGEPGGSSALPE